MGGPLRPAGRSVTPPDVLMTDQNDPNVGKFQTARLVSPRGTRPDNHALSIAFTMS